MPEEFVTQADTVARAFHDAGYVGNDEGIAAITAYAEIRLQCGKMIVCDLRPCAGDHREQCGFAHVRKSHKTQISYGFKLQFHFQPHALLTGFGIIRSLPRRRCKMLVSVSASPAVQKHLGHVCFEHICQYASALRIFNQSAFRHDDLYRSAVETRASAVRAVLAVFCNKRTLIAEVHQRMHAVGGNENHVSATSAVSPVRSAGLDELFAVEGNTAIPAVSRLDLDPNFIYEHVFSVCL